MKYTMIAYITASINADIIRRPDSSGSLVASTEPSTVGDSGEACISQENR